MLPLFAIGLANGPKTVNPNPDQQAATQCSLNPAEMCANAFSKWPLLLYLITQSSVNFDVIAVCHGEAHLARVWELAAAGCVSFAAHLEPCSAGPGLRQWQLSWQWLENIPPPLGFCFSLRQTTSGFFFGGGGGSLFTYLFFDSLTYMIVTSHLP